MVTARATVIIETDDEIIYLSTDKAERYDIQMHPVRVPSDDNWARYDPTLDRTVSIHYHGPAPTRLVKPKVPG